MSEILLELPDNHSPHAYQLLQEDPHFAAFLLDSAKTIVALEATSRNPGKLPVERWRQESPFKQFHDDILERYRMNLPPAGRLRDAFLAAAKYADDNDGRWTTYFVPCVTKKKITVKGTVINDGVPAYAELVIAGGIQALKRHVERPPDGVDAMEMIERFIHLSWSWRWMKVPYLSLACTCL
jgi:hypothetical protein